ncbi:MAG: enoyl-CoA hydratase/isomerase family protein [Marmoricola sp.]|nr:enoyl-CoA hydratase/isomerase family protein [Marmoricola sp.]
METVTLADLVDGAATLRIAPDGTPINPLTVVDLDTARPSGPLPPTRHGVIVGVGAADASTLPWLTTVAAPEELEAIAATVAAAPLAALTLVGLLELTAEASVADGLLAESLAYSMLLAGSEFRAWRGRSPRAPVPAEREPVLLDREGDLLTITLDRPARHNAFGREVRDGLLAGLEIAALDPAVTVLLSGNGRSFCSGGDLDEFGTAEDPTVAHLVRIQQSAAWAVHRLRDRVRVVVHGACIGAGVEVPSFAGRVEARDDAFFRLPELGMGLVPGAGGTVGITKRIGRWRTAHLALTDRPVDVRTALEWGLVDERAR